MTTAPSGAEGCAMIAVSVSLHMRRWRQSLIVIKKDNNREQYDRSKIEKGVLLACHKRPISADTISKLVDEVEIEIFAREEKEIPTSLIGELIMDRLKDLDAVAYVRFASVYREFKDVNTFMTELKKMLDTK